MAALQKYKTVLAIAQDASLQLDLTRPTGVYDSLDGNVQLMGSVINTAGILVNGAFPWQQLKEVMDCTGDGVTTQFELPEDFDRFTDNTGWSSAIRRPVVVVNDQQWAEISTWLSQSFYVNPACRIYQDCVEFLSPPADGDVVSFQYQRATWVIDGEDPTEFKVECTKNSDIPMFDFTLLQIAIKIKWREAKGFDTTSVQNDFNDRLTQLTGSNTMAPILTLSGPVPGGFRYLDGYNAPDTNYGV